MAFYVSYRRAKDATPTGASRGMKAEADRDAVAAGRSLDVAGQ
jgi:hypothetical protein